MATDRIRRSYDATRMYRRVVAQQGRVTVEADANEADEIRLDESRAELIDIIGPTGTPDDGFKISLPGGGDLDFAIAPGTLYVGGVRVELAQRETYDHQDQTEWVDRLDDPDPARAAPPFTELVYLMVTEQEVSAVEDPVLREVALGGPDTTGRTRMIQRVHRAAITKGDCDAALVEVLARRSLALESATMRASSTALLRVDFVPGADTVDACQPTAQSGFMGAENQLIRVQVSAERKLLWGYDNASFLYRATMKSATEIRLEGIPVDVFHLPRPDQWIELLDTAVDLKGGSFVASAAGTAYQVRSYDPTQNVITLKTAPVLAGNPPQRFVRMWETQVEFVDNDATATVLLTAENVSTGVRIYTSGTPVAADYWMIGVRPSNPQSVLPDRLHSPQSPDGPSRWATALATIAWADPRSGAVHDCRRSFERLTEDDDDLSFHNQHLHGWGVVCGLQVRCMTQKYADAHRLDKRTCVTVNDGYAIHPTGSDIIIRSEAGDELTPLKLVDLAVADGALQKAPDGTIVDGAVSLYVEKNGAFHCTKFDPAPTSKWEQLLDGTILMDIYNDCVLDVIQFVQGEITPGASAGLVGAVAERVIAVNNLLAQVLFPTSGQHVYLSGEIDPKYLETEDAILRAFYNKLKDKLQSKSFCAMFDGVDYPPYNVYRAGFSTTTPHPTTIFGTSSHTRIRVHPTLAIACTCGNKNKINVYDLGKQRLVASFDFPAGVDAEVQDVAFGPNGAFYAIAWIGTAQVDSMFAAGTIGADGEIAWSIGNQVTCQLKLTTLAICEATPTIVYAAARGLGVYPFDPAALTATPTALRAFKASGHLVAARGRYAWMLYAGDSVEDLNSNVFHQVVGIDVRSTNGLQYFNLSQTTGEVGNGHDDLAVAQSGDNTVNSLMAVIDGAQPGTKQLVVWESFEPGRPKRHVDLHESGACAIAYSKAGNWSLVTYEDTFLGCVYRPGTDTLVDKVIHPLQLGPVSVATDGPGDWFCVLEHLSNTITLIPAKADAATPWASVIDVPKLEAYRGAVITAFLKLLGRFVQYLKDCVCDHLLVDCPDPTGKKVVLADICVKNGEVYQICNFHHRKYVHTFPTVEYWMSFVPIIPLIKMQVEKLCCGALAGLFDKYIPPKDGSAAGPDKLSATQLRYGKSYIKDVNLNYQWQSLKLQGLAGAMLGKQTLTEKLRVPPPGKMSSPIGSLSFVNRTAAEAKKLALAKGINVRTVVKASDPVTTAFKVALSSPSIQPGDTVDLVTDDKGRVIGLAKAAISIAGTPSPLATADDVTALRDQLKSMETLHQQHVATIAEMQKQMAQLKTSVDAIK